MKVIYTPDNYSYGSSDAEITQLKFCKGSFLKLSQGPILKHKEIKLYIN